MARTIQLVEAGGKAPELDAAVSRALLDAVAKGERPESLRLWQPADALAFSGTDRARAGFGRARAAAERLGFAPFLRMTGGQAAVYTPATLAFAWVVPAEEARAGIGERFDQLAAWVAAALRRLGVDARVGAVPGEYCPGDHSVNARGRRKLMGVGQRVVRGAALVGGVIVVGRSARVRAVLEPVYAELALPLDPTAVGSVEDEVPGVGLPEVREALLAELAPRYRVETGEIDPSLLARAEHLQALHRIDAVAPAPAGGHKLVVEPGNSEPRPEPAGR